MLHRSCGDEKYRHSILKMSDKRKMHRWSSLQFVADSRLETSRSFSLRTIRFRAYVSAFEALVQIDVDTELYRSVKTSFDDPPFQDISRLSHQLLCRYLEKERYTDLKAYYRDNKADDHADESPQFQNKWPDINHSCLIEPWSKL